jgi:hypothetical protein
VGAMSSWLNGGMVSWAVMRIIVILLGLIIMPFALTAIMAKSLK